MLASQEHGRGGPLILLLHWLGGSARTWNGVADGLGALGYRAIGVDLPGFGLSSDDSGYTISAMAEAVEDAIRELRAEGNDSARWLLAGHSMGGAVAAVIARHSLDGASGLGGLCGLVLVSPSPPGPEPMDQSKRSELIANLGHQHADSQRAYAQAAAFVDDNTGKLPLPEGIRRRTVEDVSHGSPAAFRAWLEHGSKEDWRDRIGLLSLPALVFAGTEEEALGPHVQRELTMPHLRSDAELVPLRGAGHLGPVERPGEMILRIVDFAATQGLQGERQASTLGQSFRALIDSDATSAQTRAVLEERLTAGTSREARRLFDREQFFTLQALTACVVPRAAFDLAARLEQSLAPNAGDGWRFASLPPDVEAWRDGLRSLDAAAERAHGVPFVALYPEQQHALLTEAAAGGLDKGLLGHLHLGEAASLFSGSQMMQWFEDVRGELTRLYVADPRTLELMGFTGFADEHGFTQIRLGEREEFEQ